MPDDRYFEAERGVPDVTPKQGDTGHNIQGDTTKKIELPEKGRLCDRFALLAAT